MDRRRHISVGRRKHISTFNTIASLDQQSGGFARVLTQWENDFVREWQSPDGDARGQILEVRRVDPVSKEMTQHHVVS